MNISLRAVLFFLVLLVAAGGAITVNSTEPAAPENSHSSGPCVAKGVTLVIDYGKTGPATVVRCANNFSGNSWQLFAAVELLVQGTAEYPQSFVCRINDWPKNQSCTSTPNPHTGYWKYFIATGENTSWQFSPVGAASRQPKCGDFEGWLYVSQDAQPAHEPAVPNVEPGAFKCRN